MTPSTTTLRVVIPFRGSLNDLLPLVSAVTEQLQSGDDLIIVDDASPVPLAIPDADSVSVIRSSRPIGPYAARNLGVMASRDRPPDAVVFVDGRCRPSGDWLATIRQHVRPRLVLAGTVTVVAGRTIAERAATDRRIFDHDHYQGVWFLPYFPTCNLTIPYDSFMAGNGFREIRSGGDADLCWRLQLHHQCSLDFIEARVDWLPRQKLVQWAEQWFRYGVGSWELYSRHKVNGAPPPPNAPTLRALAMLILRGLKLIVRLPSTVDRRLRFAHLLADSAYFGGALWARLKSRTV